MKIIFIFAIAILLICSVNCEQGQRRRKRSRHTLKTKTVNLSGGYVYPSPADSQLTETIAILATNDIHGHMRPVEKVDPNDISLTTQASGTYLLTSFQKALKDEWGTKLLWLDAGDHWTGGYESSLLKGDQVVEFFNRHQPDASTFGNHEFDYGLTQLKTNLAKEQFDRLTSNFVDADSNVLSFSDHMKENKIVTIGAIKVGIFGMTTLQTIAALGDTPRQELNTLQYKFNNLADTARAESKKLRDAGADIVLLTTHVGSDCTQSKPGMKDLLLLALRNKDTAQKAVCDPSSELQELFTALGKNSGVIDAVVSGHIHECAHLWLDSVPIVIGKWYGEYFNVIYLTIDKNTKKVTNSQIEGPVPICKKVFANINTCYYNEYIHGDKTKIGALTAFTYHGATMDFAEADAERTYFINTYAEKAKMKEVEDMEAVKVGTVAQDMTKSFNEESAISNFACDAFQDEASADVCIIPFGAIRSEWFQGPLSALSIKETFPFGGQKWVFSVPGRVLYKILEALQSGSKAFYQTSGIKMTVKMNPSKKLVSAVKESDNTEFSDSDTKFKVVVDGFLACGGDDFALVYEKQILPQELKTLFSELTANLKAKDETAIAATIVKINALPGGYDFEVRAKKDIDIVTDYVKAKTTAHVNLNQDGADLKRRLVVTGERKARKLRRRHHH